MKYVVISRLAPGVRRSPGARRVYEGWLPTGTESAWAGTDGKTFINIIESDILT